MSHGHKKENVFSLVIIGGGISGLYLAHLVEKRYGHNVKIALIEEKKVLGGRTRMEMFHGHCVTTGAGIGRLEKDHLLATLQKQISNNGRLDTYKTNICYRFEKPVDTLSYINFLKTQKEFLFQHRYTMTFQQCFLHFFSPQEYHNFCLSNGGTDFQDADIIDTVYHYGFEDNTNGQDIFRVDWNRIITFLSKSLKYTTVMKETIFEKYSSVLDETGVQDFHIQTLSKNSPLVFKAKNICFAGTLHNFPFPFVTSQIGYNSFLRLYVYLEKRDTIHSSLEYVSTPFQKTIKISPRILMLSYSDNQHADTVHRFSKMKIQSYLGSTEKIKDLKKYYWKHGTHFYKPLSPDFSSRFAFIRKAQHPSPHIFLVGECISMDQGWTEGALRSVHCILKPLFQNLSSCVVNNKLE